MKHLIRDPGVRTRCEPLSFKREEHTISAQERRLRSSEAICSSLTDESWTFLDFEKARNVQDKMHGLSGLIDKPRDMINRRSSGCDHIAFAMDVTTGRSLGCDHPKILRI
ncbi:hypothetical protein PoB_006096800 [Plakobranchus ocellatus]|uniref:Uncharacterized protein n=1 Tax=Plakobranchus ocellatus TaxID=259542 RepID=A0AAV4CRE8_9GAST|nr:hypothetical protein PoB_006096800 [Plakobranchus ocellatus]